MHGLTLLSVVLLALSTLATAESHIHRVSHRGVHRRHHARSQGSAASGQPRRRACPVNSTSSAAPASSSVPANTLIAVSSSTDAAASSSAAPTSTVTASDDQPTTTSKASASSSKASSSSSSATSTSSSATATASSTDKGAATELVGKLFPVANAIASWSTASSGLEKSTALALSDATLRMTRVFAGTTHTYMQWEGKSAMRAVYPAGSYNFKSKPGGFSWYGYGPASVDLTTAREVTLAYSVYFEKGFQFVLGGKMPGLYGGDSDDGSISCSGGDRDDKCWSSRLMWRTPTNGVAAGELYTYLPPSPAANTKVCNIAPMSDCNPTYGASVGRGAYTIPSGQWVTLAQRVRLNDVGQSNGAIEVYVNGRSVISASGIVLRTSSAGRIRGIMGQTFFGGSTTAWASPKDQNSYFADFSVAITEKL